MVQAAVLMWRCDHQTKRFSRWENYATWHNEHIESLEDHLRDEGYILDTMQKEERDIFSVPADFASPAAIV